MRKDIHHYFWRVIIEKPRPELQDLFSFYLVYLSSLLSIMSYSLRSRRRVLAERNEQPSDQLKIDFPVRRKRQQENIVVSKVTSPSKRDKTCG